MSSQQTPAKIPPPYCNCNKWKNGGGKKRKEGWENERNT